MLGETQAMAMTPLLSDEQPEPSAQADTSAPDQEYAVPPAAASGPRGADATHDAATHDAATHDAGDDVDGGGAGPERHDAPRTVEPEDSGPVPVVASDGDGSPFEIDEVEALPEDIDSVFDLHEGASDFVPVTPRHHDRRAPEGR
jgi:hypothetical protein